VGDIGDKSIVLMVIDLRRITIEIAGIGQAIAELDERNPGIAEQLLQKLPLIGKANLWGEEVYFEIPLNLDNENTSLCASTGDISYWSPGPALCYLLRSDSAIFCGKPPGKSNGWLGFIQKDQRREQNSVK
jgi:hypothetical protein